MFEILTSYVIGLGPFVALATVLGVGLPFLLLTARPSQWLVAFSVLILCIVPFGGADISVGSEGSIIRQIGWGYCFLLALFFFIRDEHGKYSIPWHWLPLPLLLLIAYAFTSIAWSEVPLVSAKRALQLVGVLLIALSLTRNSKAGDVLLQFSWPGLVVLLLGTIAIAIPSLAFDQDGNYKGITFTKNVWGQFALLMSLVYLLQALSGERPRRNRWLFALASGSLLATRSATTIAIFAVALSIIATWALSRRYHQQVFVIGLAFVLIGATIAFGYFVVEGELPLDSIFARSLDSVGKDTTLTGRTALWHMMGLEIDRHPWLGAGYGGYWLGLEGPSATVVSFFSWRPGQAHNGYIDVINELGYVGLALLISVLAIHARNIYLIRRRHDGLFAVLHLAILAAALLLNGSESSLMRTTHLWWIVLTISIVEVHVRLSSERPIIASGCETVPLSRKELS
jgi:exopolysaccharide production protein ExoQ